MRSSAFLLCLMWLLSGTAILSAQEEAAQDTAGRAATQDTAMQAAALVVEGAVITSNVMDRQPADTLTTVPADAGQVYLWTRVTGAAGEVQINHVWYRGDEEVARIPLRVASSDWRTWSSKKFDPSWTGEWRVEVVGPSGDVLETVSFTVG